MNPNWKEELQSILNKYFPFDVSASSLNIELSFLIDETKKQAYTDGAKSGWNNGYKQAQSEMREEIRAWSDESGKLTDEDIEELLIYLNKLK